jgi:hypothetical protein
MNASKVIADALSAQAGNSSTSFSRVSSAIEEQAAEGVVPNMKMRRYGPLVFALRKRGGE